MRSHEPTRSSSSSARSRTPGSARDSDQRGPHQPESAVLPSTGYSPWSAPRARILSSLLLIACMLQVFQRTYARSASHHGTEWHLSSRQFGHLRQFLLRPRSHRFIPEL